MKDTIIALFQQILDTIRNIGGSENFLAKITEIISNLFGAFMNKEEA